MDTQTHSLCLFCGSLLSFTPISIFSSLLYATARMQIESPKSIFDNRLMHLLRLISMLSPQSFLGHLSHYSSHIFVPFPFISPLWLPPLFFIFPLFFACLSIFLGGLGAVPPPDLRPWGGLSGLDHSFFPFQISFLVGPHIFW